MSDETEHPSDELPLEGAGARLARARAAAGLTQEQIAATTRIPQRHLKAIEAEDFSALPSRTYALGFSRTYAQAVDLNETEIADQVRRQLAEAGDHRDRHRSATFEPGDPARIPSRRLAWFSAIAALLLIVGGFAFFRGYFIPGSGPASLIGGEQAAENTVAGVADTMPAPAAAATAVSGPVIFTSLEDGVWVRFYDAKGVRLTEKLMSKGERYTVPADADGPQIWTGQPEALSITVGGKPVGKLAEESAIIRDVAVTGQALLARRAAAPVDPAPQ